MQVNFTKLYRLWHLLTAVSIFGIFITFYAGYNQTLNIWSTSMLNLHTIFIGMLLSGVVTRLYMAFTGINNIPLMHLNPCKIYITSSSSFWLYSDVYSSFDNAS